MSFSVVFELDDLQGLHDRDAGLHEHAHLAGEVHDLFAGTFFLVISNLRMLFFLLDLRAAGIHVGQVRGALRRTTWPSRHRRPSCRIVERAVAELGHRSLVLSS